MHDQYTTRIAGLIRSRLKRLWGAICAGRAAFRVARLEERAGRTPRAIVLHASQRGGSGWDAYPSCYRDDGVAAAALMQQRIGQRHRYRVIGRTADAEQQAISLISGGSA